jgi:hypothetical protein
MNAMLIIRNALAQGIAELEASAWCWRRWCRGRCARCSSAGGPWGSRRVAELPQSQFPKRRRNMKGRPLE